MEPRIVEAIKSLAGNDTPFEITDGVISNWDYGDVKTNVTQPTQAEIDAEVTRLQGVYDGNAYQRTRGDAYPSIGDQLDMIYHNGDGGATFQAAIKAVKDATPKP